MNGGEVMRAALAGALFLAIFGLAELWRVTRAPPVELTRKLVHFLGGIMTAAFPWLFSSHWTVLALGSAFFLILWGTRRLGWLQSVHAVTRKSDGGLYFPISVYLLFVIGSDRPVFFLISVLVLVISDAMAAVLGSVYGRVGYLVERDTRTVEGSTVFFLSTFLIVHLPLLLLARMDPQVTVLVGILVALIVTMLEGICVRGNDNLVIPLATFFALLKLTKETPEYLVYQLGALVVLVAVVAYLARRIRFLNASGAMALILFLYGTFSLGGEEWIAAPALALLAFALFHLVRVRAAGQQHVEYQVVATFYAAAMPTALFLTNNIFETLVPRPGQLGEGDPFFALYVGAVAAQIAVVLDHLERALPRRRFAGALWVPLALAVATWIVVVPLGLSAGVDGVTARGLAAATFVLGAGVAAHEIVRRTGWWPAGAPWLGRLQAASVLAAVILAAPFALP